MKRVVPPLAPRHPIPKMTDAQWRCWFAGIMDGEGSIWLSRPKANGQTRYVSVSIGNTDQRMIDAIYPRVGVGRVWCERRSGNPRRLNNGDIWIWRVRNMQECRVVIDLLYPFLVVKREAADAAIAFIDSRLYRLPRRDAEVRRAIKSGMTGKEAAKHFGVSPQTISRILRGHEWASQRKLNEDRGLPRYARHHGLNSQKRP